MSGGIQPPVKNWPKRRPKYSRSWLSRLSWSRAAKALYALPMTLWDCGGTTNQNKAATLPAAAFTITQS